MDPKSVGAGGISFPFKRGTWFEEYPSSTRPRHIVNGHLQALFGILDCYRVTRDPQGKTLFDSGIAAPEGKIHLYDIFNWPAHARTNTTDLVSDAYQKFIIEQLRLLHAITGSVILRKHYSKWSTSQAYDELFVHLAAREFQKSRELPARK